MYKEKYVFADGSGALICRNCRGQYLEDANIGAWQCRIHRDRPIGGVYPCCGLHFDVQSMAGSTSGYPPVDVDALQGCYACDHDIDFTMRQTDCIYFVGPVKWQRDIHPRPEAVKAHFICAGAIVGSIAAIITWGEHDDLPDPAIVKQQIADQFLAEYLTTNLDQVTFFRDYLTGLHDSGEAAYVELHEKLLAICRRVRQLSRHRERREFQMHRRQAEQVDDEITARADPVPDWPLFSRLWEETQALLAPDTILTHRPLAIERAALVNYCRDNANVLDIWHLYEIHRISDQQQISVLAEARQRSWLS